MSFLDFTLFPTSILREIGLLYCVLASSENLGDSMQRAARFSTIANEGISPRFRDEDQIAMTFTFGPRPPPGADILRQRTVHGRPVELEAGDWRLRSRRASA
jgi:hypothetical protein